MRDRRFLALGDSYTIGEAVETRDRWPEQIVRALRTRGVAIGDPIVIATTGWTTDELMAGIDRAAPRGPFDLVSLLIGVNDQYRDRTVEAFRHGFLALLQRAIGFADNHASKVVTVSIPDWGVTPFAVDQGRNATAVARAIDGYNHVVETESRRVGCHYVDITGLSRRARSDPGLLAADGLHPSVRMYRLWTERLLPVVHAILDESATRHRSRQSADPDPS